MTAEELRAHRSHFPSVAFLIRTSPALALDTLHAV